MDMNHPTNGNPQADVPATRQTYLPSTEFREQIPDWNDEEINLRDYLDILLRRKWLIFSIVFLVLLSTIVFTLTTTKIYKANATMEVSGGDVNITKFEDVVDDEINQRENIVTQVGLLKSKATVKRVIDKLDLANHPVVRDTILGPEDQKTSLIATLKNWIKSLLPTDPIESSVAMAVSEEDIIEKKLFEFVGKNLVASANRKSMIINIAYTSPNRQLSQNVINTLLDEFLAWKMDQKLAASENARSFLMKQIDRAKINLESAEEKLNAFAKQAGIVSLDTKLNHIYSQLSEFNTALGTAEADLINKEAIYQQALQEGASTLTQVLNNPVISELKNKYAELQSEYEELATTFHDAYPTVKVVIARMQIIADRIAQEEQKVFAAVENTYRSALKRVGTLRVRVEMQKQLALDLNERTTQYRIMEREVNTNKAIYQSLLERVKEVESMVGITPSNIHIVDRASLPILPFKPNVKLNLMLALVIGLFLGVGSAFVMEYFEDTITNPDQISDRFQIPILGVVPLSGKTDYPLEKTFYEDPKAPLAEAMRTAKVSVQLSGAEDQSRCFLITSTSPGEGKTTLACNMAQCFAGAGEKVVLVDCDLRKPRVHKVFGDISTSSTNGVSNFLAGIEPKIQSYKTGIDNFHYVPSGPIPPNPVELLASSRFLKLLESLRDAYDRIILDGPPHHGFADILVLSRAVGGVILVSSLGDTKREALRQFKRGMQNVSGNILGCIINKVNLNKRYGYKSYYRYYYAYNYDYGEQELKKKKRKKK